MEFVSGKCYVEYLNTGHFSKPVIDCRLWFVSIMPKLNKTLAGMSMDIIHCTCNNINIMLILTPTWSFQLEQIIRSRGGLY